MKKLFFLSIVLFTLTACSLSNTPKGKTEAYLNQYNSLSDSVIADLETKVASENLSDESKKIYKEVLSKQYENMKYEIKEETIDGDNATVDVKITVYDLYKSDKISNQYLTENPNEFSENNVYNQDLFNKYRVENMLKFKETIDYDVTFNLVKKDKEWVVQTPDRVTLEKLHGLYNYENE